MTPEELAARHPLLYHATHPANLEGILQHGLLATNTLLSLYGLSETEREAFVRRRRPESVLLQNPNVGQTVITDNIPLIESSLARYLDDGLTTADWCTKLNERVFFFVDKSGLNGLLNAAAIRSQERLVLTFDTLSLTTAYAQKMELSAINSGNSRRKPARRGHATFTPLLQHNYQVWRRLRMERGEKKTLDSIEEVTVVGGIERVERFLLDHYVVRGGAH